MHYDISQGHGAEKQCPWSAGGHFGIFLGHILVYILIFVDIHSIFRHQTL